MAICTPFVADSAGRVTVCTSASRPSGSDLYVGKYIYETDTQRTLLYDGSGWVIMNEPTLTFTPTWASGVTTTGGTNTGSYHRSDGWLDMTASFTLGAGSAITGNVTLTLPVAAFAGTGSSFEVTYLNSSASQTYIGVVTSTTTTLTLLATQVEAAAVTVSVYSAALAGSVPFRVGAAAEAWGTGDVISVSGRYRMTTRYS